MRQWQSGEFDRDLLKPIFHRFMPAQAVDSLTVLKPQELWDKGKRLLLLDVDNTIVKWHGEEFAPEVVAWVEEAKRVGFNLCILSNTRRTDRLQRLSQKLGVDVVQGKFKPSRAMYRLALIKYKRKAEEALMIGDQLMTDVLGANRAKIDAIWVQRMDGPEFVGTKFNRFIEGLLTGPIYKALVLPEDRPPVFPDNPSPAESTLVQQLVRFAVVGGSSFVIDAGLTYVFMRWIHVNGVQLGHVTGEWLRSSFPTVFRFAASDDKAAAPLLGGLASFIAMFNSFYWNRNWTFEARGKDAKVAQATRFYIVSIIGALLNTLLYSVFYNLLVIHASKGILISKALAAFLVAIYNYLGQRFFAFRERGK